MKPPTTVLFVCLHGAAKSLIAARFLERMAAEQGLRVECRFAGLEPDDAIPSGVIEGMAADGFDVSGERPVAANKPDVAAADQVVAFGCDVTPLGAPRAIRWNGIPDVSDDYGVARDAIVSRLRELLETLPSRTNRTTI